MTTPQKTTLAARLRATPDTTPTLPEYRAQMQALANGTHRRTERHDAWTAVVGILVLALLALCLEVLIFHTAPMYATAIIAGVAVVVCGLILAEVY